MGSGGQAGRGRAGTGLAAAGPNRRGRNRDLGSPHRRDPFLAASLASSRCRRQPCARDRCLARARARRIPPGSRSAPALRGAGLESAMAVIGIGIDLVDNAEAARLLDRWGDRLLRRLLTDAEREYVIRAALPAQHLAVRLAAKEAVYKALQSLPGSRALRWRQIEVLRQNSGRPTVVLHAEAAGVASQGGVVDRTSVVEGGGGG